jgi:7-carboxy-7-deazaguanine synthase
MEKLQRLAPLEGKKPGELIVHEIYRSIQGESTFAGLPCVFVRLTACLARCTWCDTPHAFNEGKAVSLEEVIERVLAFGCPLVEITGGEPLLQEETLPLMARLADAGLTVLLETSGLVSIEGVDPRVRVVMDIKCPGSGESANNLWTNLGHLKPVDEIKFVIASREDFDWMLEVVQRHELDRRFTVLVSGVFGAVEPVMLAEWVLESGLPLRMQLQMHKYIWAPETRGV